MVLLRDGLLLFDPQKRRYMSKLNDHFNGEHDGEPVDYILCIYKCIYIYIWGNVASDKARCPHTGYYKTHLPQTLPTVNDSMYGSVRCSM